MRDEAEAAIGLRAAQWLFLMAITMIGSVMHGASSNLSKCQMTLISYSEDQLSLVSSFFPCSMVQFPTRYLGIPVSVTKLPKSAFQPLVDQVADRLPDWKGKLLHRSGCLTLVKTMLSTIPIYTTISLELPPWL
jgi:hypothetical protein